MKTIKILILDDDITTYQGLQETQILFEEYKFELTPYQTLKEAMEALSHNSMYDFAIVDLSLNAAQGDEGNTFIDYLIQQFNIYPIVYSGQPEKTTHNTTFISKLTRGEDNSEDILNLIIELFSIGLTSLLGVDGILQKHLKEFYWKKLSSIYSTPTDLINSGITPEALSRLYLIHLHDKLISSNDGEIRIHADELYIIPQIEKYPQNGSILKYNDELHLVVTPRCNINRTPSLQLLKIGAMNSIVEELKKCGSKKREDLHQAIANGKNEKTHYLPPSTLFQGGIVDFLDIKTVMVSEIDPDHIVGKVSNDMMRNITSRYTSYYARQGQPEFYINIEKLIEEAGN